MGVVNRRDDVASGARWIYVIPTPQILCQATMTKLYKLYQKDKGRLEFANAHYTHGNILKDRMLASQMSSTAISHYLSRPRNVYKVVLILDFPKYDQHLKAIIRATAMYLDDTWKTSTAVSDDIALMRASYLEVLRRQSTVGYKFVVQTGDADALIVDVDSKTSGNKDTTLENSYFQRILWKILMEAMSLIPMRSTKELEDGDWLPKTFPFSQFTTDAPPLKCRFKIELTGGKISGSNLHVFGDDGIAQATIHKMSDCSDHEMFSSIQTVMVYVLRECGMGVRLSDMAMTIWNGDFLQASIGTGYCRRLRAPEAHERPSHGDYLSQVDTMLGALVAGESANAYANKLMSIASLAEIKGAFGYRRKINIATLMYPELSGCITPFPAPAPPYPYFIGREELYPYNAPILDVTFDVTTEEDLMARILRDDVSQIRTTYGSPIAVDEGAKFADKLGLKDVTRPPTTRPRTFSQIVSDNQKLVQERAKTLYPQNRANMWDDPATLEGDLAQYSLLESFRVGAISAAAVAGGRDQTLAKFIKLGRLTSVMEKKGPALPTEYRIGSLGPAKHLWIRILPDTLGSIYASRTHVQTKFPSPVAGAFPVVRDHIMDVPILYGVCEEFLILQQIFGVTQERPYKARELQGTGHFSVNPIPGKTVKRIIDDHPDRITEILTAIGYTQSEQIEIIEMLGDVDFAMASRDVRSWVTGRIPEMPLSNKLFRDAVSVDQEELYYAMDSSETDSLRLAIDVQKSIAINAVCSKLYGGWRPSKDMELVAEFPTVVIFQRN
jgi:hypothetical protein